ncbi:MAG: EAL domain-containing protein [Mycobacteriales bacterium]
MNAQMSGVSWGRRATAFLLSASIAALSAVALVTFAGSPRLVAAPFSLPWWVLVPAFVVTAHFTIDFEFRREARSLQLGGLPLAIGLAFVSPIGHLAARCSGLFIDSVAWRRQPLMKMAFNVSGGAVEVAAASIALRALGPEDRPGPRLWLALLIAVTVNETVGHLTLSVIMRILRIPVTMQQLWAPLVFTAITAPLFVSLGIVAVAALWTEPLTALILALLTVGLIWAYRGHRRQSAQQQQTSDLYEFVKGLGPLDENDPATLETLQQVRELLHAKALDLALVAGDGQFRHFVVSDGDDAVGDDELSEVAREVALSGSAAAPSNVADRMATPLVGHGGMIGVLTAQDRLGVVRSFDLGDLRLLETVAKELTTALERGRLLTDLGRAATTDPLTELPNLSEVTRRIDALLAAGTATIVSAVAVDSFREVNDTLGHQVGDDLLVEVTRRLQLSHPTAILGRIGGGRFAVCVPASDFGGDAAMFGLGIRAQVEGGAQLGPIGTHVRLSVGCAIAPEHGTDASTLVRRAETAMYSARHAHGGPVMWEPAYEVQGQRRLAVVMALREALSSGAIGLAFQPKIDAQTGAVTGVEALARWTHPALGAISPDEFIPLAEASGLMGPLTSSVLRQALTACKGWQRRGGRIGVAVNVSADTVLDPGFVTEVAALLTSTNVSSDLLTLELTEGVLVADPKLAAERMAELRAIGVKLSVDDFGTGYSSLTYLKGLPMDEVKIDKGFVDAVVDDAGDRAVVRAVVDIAHTLGLRAVAEGVEQEEQHRVLRELGVDEVQGYLHARPMAALDMASWLRRREAARI